MTHVEYLREIVFLKHEYDSATLTEVGTYSNRNVRLYRLLAVIAKAEKELSL